MFAVAAHRCRELYDPPGAVTLWHLPAELEDDFNRAWETWLDQADKWGSFFGELETCSSDLVEEMQRLQLVNDAHLGQLSRLKRSAEQRAVSLPGEFTFSDHDITMLALAFARGENGKPAVPFQSWNGGR